MSKDIKMIGQMDNSDGTFESANRVYDRKQVALTIPTCGGGGLQPKVIKRTYKATVAMRGREKGQCLEYHTDGITNTITTVQKDNMMVCMLKD